MKKFAWPMQKLLDVTEQKEQALRVKVTDLAAEMDALQRAREERLAATRTMLDEIGRLPVQQRIERQAALQAASRTEQLAMRRFEQQQGQLKQQREAALTELRQTRVSRKTLEALREEARLEYMRQMQQLEQKELDENSQVAFARQTAEASEAEVQK